MPAVRSLTRAVVLIAAALIASCGSSNSGSFAASGQGSSAPASTTTTPAGASGALPAAQLSLVAYSTPQAAYDAIIKAFRATPQGKRITFTESFGASGDQSRAVDAGLTADIVAFSLEPDMTRLVKDKIVAASWNTGPNRGIVTDSVVAFVVRKGNPKAIHSWDDLTKKGLEVLTPNPFTSGGARWNVLAAYGAASNVGKDDAAGTTYLATLFKNVPVQDSNARAQLQTFVGGKGDVMIDYENDAIFAQQKRQAVDYLIPDRTILIENPVAVTANTRYPAQAKAFLDFMYSDAAQRIFADNGYRPITTSAAKPSESPAPSHLFTIRDLGGWSAANTKFFDPTNGVLAKIESNLGIAIKR